MGILSTTGVRCMVVYRKVPGDESHCLIVETDHLSDMYHDNLVEICNSKESQEAGELYEVLNRRTFGDGLNALQALHYKGFLRKVPVSQVLLLPFPNQQVPLEMINAQMDGNIEEYTANSQKATEDAVAAERKANPMSDPSDSEAIAQGLIIQAEMLEMEASKKRAEAEALLPSTTKSAKAATSAPASSSRGRPKLSEAEKAERAAERKIKRRERDRERAAEKKALKEEQAIKDAVDAKVVRDSKRSEQEA